MNIFSKEWGHDGVCLCRSQGHVNMKAMLCNALTDPNFSPKLFWLFEYFFPTAFVKEVIIKATNERLKEAPIPYGEFLRFIGIFLLMLTAVFESWQDFWLTKTAEEFNGPPLQFGQYMLPYRFEQILQAIRLTMKNPPSFKDRFWEVRDLICAWNERMTKAFGPSWASYFDMSMSK